MEDGSEDDYDMDDLLYEETSTSGQFIRVHDL